MENTTDNTVPIEHENDTVTQPVLRTNVNLCDDDLSEEAKAQFDFYNQILDAFQRNARIILKNDRLTPIARHLVCISIEKYFTNCKNVLNYVATHSVPQTKAQPLPPLFVLCGAMRTGSTLLYNLLACDPASRALCLLDMMDPVPPIARSDTAAQTRRNLSACTAKENLGGPIMADYEQEWQASHPSYKYEEDIIVFYQAGLLKTQLEPHDSTELRTWFFDDTKEDFVYKYHKVFMQMLNNVDAPQSHWILKTPYHAFYFNTLLRHYPSAKLIMTHRRLQDVIPSSIRLGLAFSRIYFDSTRDDAAIDRQASVKNRFDLIDVQIKRIVEFRRAHPEVPVFDILYDDLVKKPIDTVRRIYKHFGLAWSDEFEQAMLTWLRDNPQGKHGRNSYALEEFGFTYDDIEHRYED